MDFFGEQDRARKQSYLLLALFIAVMFGFAFVINGCASAIGYMLGQSDSLWTVNQFSLAITGALSAIVLIGCWLRYQDVRAGGAQLAMRFGGTKVLASSNTKTDKEFLDVVAEMSLAASIPAPSAFCLKHEISINAFVVGADDDLAIVVSQGALDKLNRDELLGVVGHEFGHLANGDLAYNMRLLVALGGLNALDEAGAHVNRTAFRRTTTENSYGQDHRYYALPLVVVGCLLRILGSVGVLAGSIVRSSFSRQREFLADASSVQFTRNTYGLASALDRISQVQRGPALHSKYKGELAHLCFQVPVRSYTVGRVFDTHPPIANRITAVDRHYSVKARKRIAKAAQQTDKQSNVAQSSANSVSIHSSDLSQRFKAIASDQSGCQAILFAMFVGKQSAEAENIFSALTFAYDKSFSKSVRHIHQELNKELAKEKVSIIDYIAPTLNSMDSTKKDTLLRNLYSMVEGIRENSLETFTTLKVVQQKIDKNASIVNCKHKADAIPETVVAIRSISDLGEELSLLLSLMIEASGYSGEKLTQEYGRILKCYTNEPYPLRSASEPNVTLELEQAFSELFKQPLSQRKAFLEHCSEIMLSDGISMVEEADLINLFAVSLDVPMLKAA